MKFIAILPPQFKFVEKKPNGLYLFHDRVTPLVKLFSPIADPFDQEWAIVSHFDRQKTDRSEYMKGFTMRLYSLTDLSKDYPRLIIYREEFKAAIAYVTRPTETFFAIEIESNYAIPNWVSYSFIRQ